MLKDMTETNNVLVCVAWPALTWEVMVTNVASTADRHIGHVAGFGVPSDVFARYQRMSGANVLMVSGTDEHGTPLLVQADKEGVTVKDLADRYNRQIVEDLAGLGLSYDLFTRTTTRNHYAVVQELFTGLYDNGYMIKETTLGAVSPSTGRTLPDRYIEGTCPICGATDARGDQCDDCGNQLDPSELIDPHSKIDGETPKFVETEHFFLDLPALADALADWLKGRTEPYNLGDEEFHLAFRVDDYDAAHALHEKMGCICYENTAMGLYFIKDPDGYWLEIVPVR